MTIRTRLLRLVAAVFGGVLLGLFSLPPTQAHVLIRDETDSFGAIFHVTPDDDPIAGETSSLYFDVQKPGFQAVDHRLELTIEDEASQQDTVDLSLAGSTASGRYTFPAQGQYRVRLELRPLSGGAQPIVFLYTQRVARGVGGGAQPAIPYPLWAEAGLFAGVLGLIILAIFAFNRRRNIVEYSQLG